MARNSRGEVVDPTEVRLLDWACFRLMVLVRCERKSPNTILAIGATCGFASRLKGRQKQGNQNANDPDDRRQLDQREATRTSSFYR